MNRTLLPGGLVVAVLALVAPSGPGQAPGGAQTAAHPTHQVGPPGAGQAPPALQYRLLPDPLDITPGNAAPLWLRAGAMARNNRHKTSEKEHSWSHNEVKLDDLPRKEVRTFLDRYKGALRLADQAARRSRCDWERDPLVFKNIWQEDAFSLDEIQTLRQIATLLSIRCRLELAEKRFDDAGHTLQTGFALARHLGGSDLLIQELVAIAVGSIMLGRVEEWAQVPGSPNLYWALTDLPRPLVPVRHSIQMEFNTLHRSFPQLRAMKKKVLPRSEAQAIAEDLLKAFHQSMGVPGGAAPSPAMSKLGIASLVIKTYPDARRYLIAQGMAAKEVEAMPSVQVVVLYFVDRYDRVRDDVLKWLSVPAWQGLGQMEKLEKQVRAQAQADGNPIVAMLLPAITRVYAAQVRSDRHIAGMRAAEALRLYASANGGKVPAKWADLTDVPLPVDPVTGKGLDAFYQVQDGKAVLSVPASPGMPLWTGRRYEYLGKGR